MAINPMNELLPAAYGSLLAEVKGRIRAAQYEALRAVNRELIALYWDIGRLIAERQEGSTWGQGVVQQLAVDLRAEFPGVGGFSASNLWRMRLFYGAYAANEKLAPLVREIGWSHNLLVLEKCHNDLEREFYLKMTKRHGWTKNVLALQIDNQTYEKTLANQTNFAQTLPNAAQATLAVKDEYTFDFLELADEHSEKQLEAALLGRIEPFLREMGGKLAFIGSQYRLEVGDQEYFLDLLLYHRALRCLVVIELKTGPFLPEYTGKMQFYLAVLNDRERQDGENPPLGIILCRTKNETIVEYALRESNQPIGVATYRLTPDLPREFKGQLPEPEQIALLLQLLD